MNPMIRTLTFVVVAAISTVVAFTANYMSKPNRHAAGVNYGELFPEFADPSRANSITIVSFDESQAAVRTFSVVHDNGWRISSHNNYPADGAEQLAKAASSLIALKRGSLATRRATEHERYGVIDPLDEKSQSLKGRGTRITLMQKGDVPLADLIVGKKVEGSQDRRYVRKFGEDAVYMVQANLDISTKFSDWAETDLLKVSGFDITQLRTTRPKFNAAGEFEANEVVELTRDKSGDPWKLNGLDEATEELNTSELSTMTNTLDDLKLVGVRAKPRDQNGRPLLTSELRMNVPAELRNDPDYVGELQRALLKNLGEKGFFLSKDDEGILQLVSREGELTVATKDGVVYRLTFGSEFTGTEEEIEIGSKESAAVESEKKSDASKTDDPKAKDDKATEKKEDEDANDPHKGHDHAKPGKGKPGELKQSRYLIVRAEFNEKLLGERPVAPVKPEAPPGVEPLPDGKSDDKKPADKKSDDSKSEDAKPEDKKSDDAKVDDKKADDKKSDDAKSEKPAEDAKSEEKPKTDAKESKDDAGAKGDDKVKAEDKKSDEEKKEEKPEKKETPAKEEPAKTDKPAEAKDEKKADQPEAKVDEPAKKDPKAEYLDAMKKYDSEKGKFNIDSKAFEAKVESGQQTVQELNDRFADWYYVISNDSFAKLRLTRVDLVKKKEPPADDKKEPATDEKKDDAPAEKDQK